MAHGTVRLVSKRKDGVKSAPDEAVIDIDRVNPILGNRHILRDHRDNAERARVIAAHGLDLDADLAVNGPMSRELDKLARRYAAGEKLALRCWCAPRPCHGQRYIAEIVSRANPHLNAEQEVTSNAHAL
jgi:hypothetical protein